MKEMAKFTWGDSVRIAEAAPASVRPGSAAEVVGVTEHHPSGIVYTVEFEDGSDAEVHEDHLIPLNDDFE
jgi:hypothetical protein